MPTILVRNLVFILLLSAVPVAASDAAAAGCDRFYDYNRPGDGFWECRAGVRANECAGSSKCASQMMCERCKCYALNLARSPKANGDGWVMPYYATWCRASIEPLQKFYRACVPQKGSDATTLNCKPATIVP